MAYGCAIYAAAAEEALSVSEIINKIATAKASDDIVTGEPLFNSYTEYDEFIDRHKQCDLGYADIRTYEGDAYLGIDAGSTTTKLVLITDDGAFAHDILSPKKHIEKTYFVKTDKPIPPDLPDKFKQGVVLYDGTQCMSADMQITGKTECTVKIKEGKYHQIKRMFRVNGLSAVYLKRTAMGGLLLDETLAEGACRELTAEELKMIKGEPLSS